MLTRDSELRLHHASSCRKSRSRAGAKAQGHEKAVRILNTTLESAAVIFDTYYTREKIYGSADVSQPFEISLVSLMFLRGTQGLSNVDDEEAHGGFAMVVHS